MESGRVYRTREVGTQQCSVRMEAKSLSSAAGLEISRHPLSHSSQSYTLEVALAEKENGDGRSQPPRELRLWMEKASSVTVP